MDRLDLFQRYCLPSVADQSEQGFRWILFVDPSTPAEFIRRLARSKRVRAFEICYSRQFEPGVLRGTAIPPTGFVISSRLDNDDAIHRLYIEDVQSAFGGQSFEWLNFPSGYVLDERRGAFLSHQPSNAFISLIEAVGKNNTPKTALCINHTDASTLGSVVQISAGVPRWIQVVHAKNVFNHVRPWDVRVNKVLKGFRIFPRHHRRY